MIVGNGGNDNITGGAGNDNLSGGIGDDALDGGAGADTLNGGTGNDTLNGGVGADTLNGGAGNDNLTLSEGDLLLDGGADDDIFNVDISKLAAQHIEGGDGEDEVIFSGAGAIDEADFASIIDNVEVLDFTDGATEATLDLSLSEVSGMTDDDDILTVKVDVGDTVTADNAATTNVTGVGETTYTFVDGTDTATLIVQVS